MLREKFFSLLLVLVLGALCYASSEETSADSSSTSSSHEEDTSEESADVTSMNKALEDLIDNFEGYEDFRTEIIQKIAEKLKNGNVNITLIGWQNIHDDEGNLKQINTLELALPSRDCVVDDSELEFDGDYDSLVQEIVNTRDLLEESDLDEANVEETLYRELYSSDGSAELYQIAMNKDESYCSYGAASSIFNKTVRNAKEEEVETFVKFHEKKHTWPVCTMTYDEGGNFVPEKSEIVPPLTVTIKNIEDEAPVDFIDALVSVVADVAAQYPVGDISEELYYALTRQMTGYTWNVIESPDTYYVSRDYGVVVTNDPMELEYRSEYYIYANRIKNETK